MKMYHWIFSIHRSWEPDRSWKRTTHPHEAAGNLKEASQEIWEHSMNIWAMLMSAFTTFGHHKTQIVLRCSLFFYLISSSQHDKTNKCRHFLKKKNTYLHCMYTYTANSSPEINIWYLLSYKAMIFCCWHLAWLHRRGRRTLLVQTILG